MPYDLSAGSRPARFLAAILVAGCLHGGALPAEEASLPGGAKRPQPSRSEKDTGAAPPAPATPEDAPTSETRLTPEYVQARVAAVESAADLPDATKKAVLDLWAAAKAQLETAAKERESAKKFKDAIEAAPKRTLEIRAELEKRAATPAAEAPLSLPDDVKTSKDLDVLLAKERADLATQQARVDALTNQLQPLQGRLTKTRDEQAAARQKLEEIQRDRNAPAPADEPKALTESRRASLEAQEISLREEISMLDQEALSQPMRLDLLQAERDLATQEVARLQARLKKLEEAGNRMRTMEADEARRKTEEARREALGKHPVVSKWAAENEKLAQESADITHENRRATPDRQFLEDQSKQLADQYKEMSGQLDELGTAGVDARVMIAERKRLPQILSEANAVAARWTGKIAETQARRFRATMELRTLTDLDLRVEEILKAEVEASTPESERQAIAAEVRKLLVVRQELLTQFQQNCDSYLETLRPLKAAHRSLADTVAKFIVLLDEFLLWIPSAPLPGRDSLDSLWEGLKLFLAPASWQQVATTLGNDVADRPYWAGLAFVVLVALVAFRRRIRRRTDAIAAKVRRVETDSYTFTIESVLLTLLLALPLPLFLFYLGWSLETATGATEFCRTVGFSLRQVARGVLFLGILLFLCRPRGLAEVHLRWRERTTKLLRFHLRWFLPVTALLIFLVVAPEQQPSETVRNGLGRLAFVLAMVAGGVLVQRILRPRGGIPEPFLQLHPDSWFARLRWVWYPLSVGSFLALVILAILGYYYTAVALERLIGETCWLILGTTIANGLILRWFIIEQRRLAVAQAKEAKERREAEASKQETAGAVGTGGEAAAIAMPLPAPEIPDFDISAINAQTRELLRVLVGTTVLVGLWAIWSSVLPALGILEDIHLWNVGTKEAPQWITAQHLAFAIIAIFLTSAAAKNLPGVLEILVLKNLPLDSGSRYAISTISRYVLGAIGIVVVFNALGLNWSSVQWLIAALSVGLGFGLQEIVANFICGIILLFERPMRVGDLVTVGDVSGMVTRIRIRATTILDWDKKELIIPNKEFITGRLLNWTLSDTLNRVPISVGVAYGTDTRRVREVLLRIAAAHPLVLKDPAPIVLFDAFGASSLDFKFFVYLPNYDNRLQVMNELRTAIAERFAEDGIEIAFPQLDIHLRDMPPQRTDERKA